MLLHFLVLFHSVVSQVYMHACLLFITSAFSPRFLILVFLYGLPAAQEETTAAWFAVVLFSFC